MNVKVRRGGVTIGEAGASTFGRPPLGPKSPGVQPIPGYIAGAWINLQNRFDWLGEITFHRPMGKVANLAPPHLSFQAAAKIVVPSRGRNRPSVQLVSAPDYGPMWIGTGE